MAAWYCILCGPAASLGREALNLNSERDLSKAEDFFSATPTLAQQASKQASDALGNSQLRKCQMAHFLFQASKLTIDRVGTERERDGQLPDRGDARLGKRRCARPSRLPALCLCLDGVACVAGTKHTAILTAVVVIWSFIHSSTLQICALCQ